MNKTNIEYLDFTWNPIAMRCTPVSDGCKNCWAIKMCNRLSGNPKISDERRRAYAGRKKPVLLDYELQAPLKCKKPAVIGVQFMGDLFHEDVKNEFIDRVMDIIAQAKQHTFIILTKRPQEIERYDKWINIRLELPYWEPFPNLWVGVTAENQQTADERIPILLQIPAAVRFVSLEPLLGPVDLAGDDGGHHFFPFENEQGTITPGISWCVAGCESGPGRRLAKIEWFRDIKDQCVSAGVPFFLKQMEFYRGHWKGKVAGRKVFKMPLLDGQVWGQMPEAG